MFYESVVSELVHSLDGKESTCNAGDLDMVRGSGRSPGEGHGNPLQRSCLENPVHRGAWRATVRGVAKSGTRRSNEHFHFPHLYISWNSIFHALFMHLCSQCLCHRQRGFWEHLTQVSSSSFLLSSKSCGIRPFSNSRTI